MDAAELHALLRRQADGATPLAIAFSGGTDSTALARLAAAAGLRPVLLHVHHGTAGADAGCDAADILASSLGLELRVLRGEIGESTRGFEAAARQLRYRLIEGAWGGRVWLAQTRDDFIETVWLRLLAGSSPQYWNVMPRQRGGFSRPLLDVRRADLGPYQQGAFDDPMNADPRIDRVWLRQSGLLDVDPEGALADAAAALGARLSGLELGAGWGALDRLPDALRAEAIRAWLQQLAPDARPRRRFVEALSRSAALPSNKTRSFRLADHALTLRQGRLMLNS